MLAERCIVHVHFKVGGDDFTLCSPFCKAMYPGLSMNIIEYSELLENVFIHICNMKQPDLIAESIIM